MVLHPKQPEAGFTQAEYSARSGYCSMSRGTQSRSLIGLRNFPWRKS